MIQRRSIHIPGFAHKNPIPGASRVGNIVVSGVINGVEPGSGSPGEGLRRQCELMFQHMRSLVEAAGGTLDNIVKVNVWMADAAQRPVLNEVWCAVFPDPASRPARHTLPGAPSSGLLVQCDFMAVL